MIDVRGRYGAKEFAALVDREGEQLELKSGTSGKRLQEVMVAFANTSGGVVLIGVADDRTVVGCRLTQGVADAIHDAAHDAYELGTPSVREVRVGRQRVVAVTIKARRDGIAQTSDGRLLVRVGARNRALLGRELTRWVSSRALDRFESTSTGVPFSERNPQALRDVTVAYGWDPDDPSLALRLRERGLLTTDGTFTIAGALVLTAPARILRTDKFIVDVRGYDDARSPVAIRRDEIGGPVQDQVRNAAALVSRDLGVDEVVARVRRHDMPRLPLRSVREAIANAIAHRRYDQTGTPVVVEVRPDRLVVRSPGPLPEGVTVETLRESQNARNPALLDVLRRFELAEDSGRGVDLIQDQMLDGFLQPPVFRDLGHAVEVVLPLGARLTKEERAWVLELEDQGLLGPVERVLLVNAARDAPLTNATARTLAGVDSTEARPALQRLRDLGLLDQHGARGGARYTLSRRLPTPASQPVSRELLAELVVREARSRPLSNADVRELTGYGRVDALNLLRDLAAQDRLTVQGERRWTRYRAGGER